MKAQDLNLSALHGQQEMTTEDRSYRGSRYAEVREALYANPYRGGTSGQEPGLLPMFKSTLRNVFRGMFFGEDKFKQAAARVLDSRADLRWGPDGKGYRRILAPNGICVLGTWEITEDNPYTGYFAKGSKGLTIGRFSNDGNETRRGQRRSISLGMKVYPTTDAGHAQPLIPASVIVQEDLGGMWTDYINDAELINVPSVHAWRRGIYILIMLRASGTFSRLDKEGESRQLYQVAELGKPADVPAKAPAYVLLRMAPGQRRIEGRDLDFRDEIYAHIFNPGDAQPSGAMEFDISVSDQGHKAGISGFTRITVEHWQRIGRVRFTEAVASYNGDHVIHFHHPGWREDRNDPRSAVRVNEKRVRR